MIKYEKMLYYYSTVLYCSIAFLGKGCDCCKKLCGDKVLNNKSNYSGCDSEKVVVRRMKVL